MNFWETQLSEELAPDVSRLTTSTVLSSTGNHRGPISSKSALTASSERPCGPASSAAFVTENRRSAPSRSASVNRLRRKGSPFARSMREKLSRYTANRLTDALNVRGGPLVVDVAP